MDARKHLRRGWNTWVNRRSYRYRLVRLSRHREKTFKHVAEWREYESERDWLSATTETAIDHEFDCFYDEYPDWRITLMYRKERNWPYVVMYLIAIVAANLLVVRFGPWVTIFNAFVLIGLDLTARDRLHDAWKGRRLWPKMFLLIAAGSAISYLLNRDAGQIALASMVAFGAAGVVDAIVYHLLGGYPRWMRVNGSNVPSAAVDSIIFPTLAFGGFLPLVTLGQFAAKVSGGFVWSLVLQKKWPD